MKFRVPRGGPRKKHDFRCFGTLFELKPSRGVHKIILKKWDSRKRIYISRHIFDSERGSLFRQFLTNFLSRIEFRYQLSII